MWKEEFDKIIVDGGGFYLEAVKQFISDLRKKDMKELIKMLPEIRNSGVDDGDYTDEANFKRIGVSYRNLAIDQIRAIIKDYFKE